MQLEKFFADWPVDNVAGALVGKQDASFGDQGKVFELASVTKLLSAYTVLMAVEEGAFELDSPARPKGATIRHLLAHAAGVSFDSREPQKAPGERRIYSSAGYEILADIVEESTGIPFADYAREGVFEPLGMESTEIYGSAGHGGRSTVADLSLFAGELLSPQLLDPSTVREAFSNQFGDLRGVVPGYGMQKPCPWGLGFEIKADKSPHWTGDGMPADTVGHFGMAGTYLWVAGDQACVVLTDREFGDWAKPLWQETNTALWDTLS